MSGAATTSEPSSNGGDHLRILSGTSQNVLGIVIAAVATFAANILLSRTLGASGFGVVTLVTQGAFVLSFATRAGMDMAVLRDVAIDVGQGRWGRVRVPVARATLPAPAAMLIGVSSVTSGGGRGTPAAGGAPDASCTSA